MLANNSGAVNQQYAIGQFVEQLTVDFQPLPGPTLTTDQSDQQGQEQQGGGEGEDD